MISKAMRLICRWKVKRQMLVSTAAEALKIDPNDDNEKNKLKQHERHLQIDCGYYLNDFRRLPHCSSIHTRDSSLIQFITRFESRCW